MNAGAIPNFATEKEQKRNFFDFIDVTLVAWNIHFWIDTSLESKSFTCELIDLTLAQLDVNDHLVPFS